MALTDNIVSYWKLDEASGNAADSVGSNTLTNNNSVTYSAALINNGANLGSANTNKFLSNTGNLGITAQAAFSVVIWVKLLAEIASGQWDLFTLGDTATGQLRLIRYEYNAGTQRVNFYKGTTNLRSTITLGTSTFHQLALTFDGTTLTGYIDGSSIGTSTPATTSNGETNFTAFGSGDGLPSNTASSLLDEMGFWSRALTAGEVTSLYNGGAGIQYPFGATAAYSTALLLGV